MYPKRRNQYLCLGDSFSYVHGSARVKPFGFNTLQKKSVISASRTANLLGLGNKIREKYVQEVADPQLCENEVLDDFTRNAMYHGSNYEHDASLMFLDRMRYSWKPIGNVEEQLTYTVKYVNVGQPKSKPFTIGATPDLLLYSPADQSRALLEIKCPYRKWLDQSDIYDEETAWSLLADKHYIQCQIQMLITQIQKCFLFFYVPHRDGSPSFNSCTWKIDADRPFQHFLLAQIEQAYQEVEKEERDKFALIRNEGAHNRVITHESKIQHVTFLLP